MRVRREGFEAVHHRRGLGAAQVLEAQRARVGVGATAEHHRRMQARMGQRRPVHLCIGGIDQRRAQRVEDAVDLGVVLRQPAVGAGDGAHRHADVHAGQQQQQVVERVVRQHHDRRLRRELQIQQPLGNAADRGTRLRPTQAAPVAAGRAFGERRRVGRLGSPALQPFADAARIGPQRLGRAQHEAAVVEADAYRARRRQPMRIVEPGCSHVVSIHLCMCTARIVEP